MTSIFIRKSLPRRRQNERSQAIYLTLKFPHLVHGRTNGSLTPLTLFWTAAGLELNVRGSELWVEFTADWDIHEPWYSFVVNGEFLLPPHGAEGHGARVRVPAAWTPKRSQNVRIFKDTQAMNARPGECFAD